MFANGTNPPTVGIAQLGQMLQSLGVSADTASLTAVLGQLSLGTQTAGGLVVDAPSFRALVKGLRLFDPAVTGNHHCGPSPVPSSPGVFHTPPSINAQPSSPSPNTETVGGVFRRLAATASGTISRHHLRDALLAVGLPVEAPAVEHALFTGLQALHDPAGLTDAEFRALVKHVKAAHDASSPHGARAETVGDVFRRMAVRHGSDSYLALERLDEAVGALGFPLARARVARAIGMRHYAEAAAAGAPGLTQSQFRSVTKELRTTATH